MNISCFVLLIFLTLNSDLFSQSRIYLYPVSSISTSHFYTYPVIPLKQLLHIASLNELESRNILKSNIKKFCKNNLFKNEQPGKTIIEQHNSWRLIHSHYEYQVSSLLQKSLNHHNSNNKSDQRLAIRNLRIKRQTIVKDIWLKIITKKYTDHDECLEFGLEQLNLQKGFHTKPLYLAQYRFWKNIPLLKREKIINILSNPVPNSLR